MSRLDGLKVSRWPLIFVAVVAGVVFFFDLWDNLQLVLALVLVAPAVVGVAFLTSKTLWDTYAKKVGFRLPEDRLASLALFIAILWAVAWIVG